MPRDPQILIFIGVKRFVIALDERTGFEAWRTELHSGEYVTVLWDGESLFAANAGEVWRLDPKDGSVIWHNELKGDGRGMISLASSRRSSQASEMDLAEEKRRRDAQQAAAASAAAG
jgi:outer membrane protein assembly factor BamB